MMLLQVEAGQQWSARGDGGPTGTGVRGGSQGRQPAVGLPGRTFYNLPINRMLVTKSDAPNNSGKYVASNVAGARNQ